MKKIIVANWKCHPAAVKTAQKMLLHLKAITKGVRVEVVVAPPFVYLTEALKIMQRSRLIGGAQNCFWEQEGAFTGEIAPIMLKNLGVRYVILGHSERVMVMGESNQMTNRKIKAALACGLKPIVCVGETSSERSSGETFKVIANEVAESFEDIKKSDYANIILAYEPLWAIGTGSNCSPDDAMTVALFLRQLLAKMSSKNQSQSIPILYGGSVAANNASGYLENGILQGLLVGAASLDLKNFGLIIDKINKLK